MRSSRPSKTLSKPPPPPGSADDGADLKDLFEAAPCGYLVLSPGGRIGRANATLCGWLGRSEQDLVGRPFHELLTVAGRIFYETNFAPLLRITGSFEELALDLVTASGEKLPTLVNASERRDANGSAVAVRVVLVRARDRRSYERELHGREQLAQQQLSDAQATARLREEFIAVLGHDLRNPLASIAGAARLLRREVQSEKALKVIQLMELSVDRMAGLIDDVMDYARGRLGSGIVVHRQPTAVEPLLRQIIDELEASHPGREVLCVVDLAGPVAIDPVRLGQLVSNLLGNALTYGDPRAPVLVTAAASPAEMVISVANAGPPIPEVAMKRLFQPFFRGEVRASQNGLGLGLHIASSIATAHGGALTVASGPEETRFTFTMPITE